MDCKQKDCKQNQIKKLAYQTFVASMDDRWNFLNGQASSVL
jgi:hypothetical protein